jgi:hypothetical protein
MKVDVLRYENQMSYILSDARSELLELSRARKTKNIETRTKKKLYASTTRQTAHQSI